MSTKFIVEEPDIHFHIPRNHRKKSKEEMIALMKKARKNNINISNPVDCTVFKNKKTGKNYG